MYDDLINAMRKCATDAFACITCTLDSNPSCTDILMKQAADAIEGLSADYESVCKDVERLEALIQMGKPKWIPVTERLPEEDTSCLVFLIGGEFGQLSWMSMAIFYNGVFRYDDHSGEFDQITHWMPLPRLLESEET